jgi:hypothetical protein
MAGTWELARGGALGRFLERNPDIETESIVGHALARLARLSQLDSEHGIEEEHQMAARLLAQLSSGTEPELALAGVSSRAGVIRGNFTRVVLHAGLLALTEADAACGASRRRLERLAAWLLAQPHTKLAAQDRPAPRPDPWIASSLPAPLTSPPCANPDFDPRKPATTRRPGGEPDENEPGVRIFGRVAAVRRHRRTVFVDLVWDAACRQVVFADEDTRLAEAIRVDDMLHVEAAALSSRLGQPWWRVVKVLGFQAACGCSPGDRDERAITAMALDTCRQALRELGFLEHALPLLSHQYFGGRSAPFSTLQKADHKRLYLRVTCEMDLLASVANGMSRVYQIGTSFRNEAFTDSRQKEYLLLEAYASSLGLEALTALCVRLVRAVMSPYVGELALRHARVDALLEEQRVSPATDPEARRRQFDELCVPHLAGLTVVGSIPGAASPFVHVHEGIAQRQLLYLNDEQIAEISINETRSEVLALRLEEQLAAEPYPVTRDYAAVLNVLKYGLPPTAGIGLGFSRLLKLAVEAHARSRSELTAVGTSRRRSSTVVAAPEALGARLAR